MVRGALSYNTDGNWSREKEEERGEREGTKGKTEKRGKDVLSIGRAESRQRSS